MLTPRDGVDDAAQISVDANGGNGAAQDSVQLSQSRPGRGACAQLGERDAAALEEGALGTRRHVDERN